MKTARSSLLFLLLLNSVIYGELVWKQELIQLQAHPLQETMEIQFAYTNAGEHAVEILGIDSSCGCLVPKSANRTIAAGEGGSLEVSFSLKGRSGKQRKYIEVETRETARPYRLDLEVDILKSYIPSIKRVIWERSEHYEPQLVKLINHYAHPIDLVKAVPTIGRISAELTPVKPGFEYDLKIIPKPGVENLRAYIRLQPAPVPGIGKIKDFKVYVFVK